MSQSKNVDVSLHFLKLTVWPILPDKTKLQQSQFSSRLIVECYLAHKTHWNVSGSICVSLYK